MSRRHRLEEKRASKDYVKDESERESVFYAT